MDERRDSEASALSCCTLIMVAPSGADATGQLGKTGELSLTARKNADSTLHTAAPGIH